MARIAKALVAVIGATMPVLIEPVSMSGSMSGTAAAQTMRDMSILTGDPKGTYHAFAQDVADLVMARCAPSLKLEAPDRIKVRPSQGSLDNLLRLRKEQSTQMAIVQQDALDFARLSAQSDPTIGALIQKLKYVHPLYLEEVHIVARRDAGLRTLADLAGKRIATGEPGSGTSLTASFVLAELPGKYTEVQIGAEAGILRLLGLAAGEPVDAVFYVAGKPVPLLSGAGRFKAEHLRRLTFVAVPNDRVPNWYSPAALAQSTYPWLDRAAQTVAVRAVLIAYDFQKEQCPNVAMVARLIQDNLDDLQRTGHTKWRDVDLTAAVPGWKRYECVERGLTVPIDRCRFLAPVDGSAPPQLPPPPQSTDCRKQCEPSGNPFVCMLCKGKQQRTELNVTP